MKIGPEGRILQFVGFVSPRERSVARTRYEPETQRLAVFLDQTDNGQITSPLFQDCASILLHGFSPVFRGPGPLHDLGRTH